MRLFVTIKAKLKNFSHRLTWQRGTTTIFKMKYISRWTERLVVEFFEQGDKERELQLQLSPLCDRNSTMVAQSQISSYLIRIHNKSLYKRCCCSQLLIFILIPFFVFFCIILDDSIKPVLTGHLFSKVLLITSSNPRLMSCSIFSPKSTVEKCETSSSAWTSRTKKKRKTRLDPPPMTY